MRKSKRRPTNGAGAPSARELEARATHKQLRRAVQLERRVRVLAHRLRVQVAVTDEALEELGITMKARADRLAHELDAATDQP